MAERLRMLSAEMMCDFNMCVHFLLKNLDFPFKNLHFLFKNLHFSYQPRAIVARETAAARLRSETQLIYLSYREDDIDAAAAVASLRTGLIGKGMAVAEVARELGHRSSHVVMASTGLEVTGTLRGCVAAIAVASRRYAVGADVAVLESACNAVGNAALSRFELSELIKLSVPIVAVGTRNGLPHHAPTAFPGVFLRDWLMPAGRTECRACCDDRSRWAHCIASALSRECFERLAVLTVWLLICI